MVDSINSIISGPFSWQGISQSRVNGEGSLDGRLRESNSLSMLAWANLSIDEDREMEASLIMDGIFWILLSLI